MSQRDDLKDMLFEQMSDLEIFERLLRFDPARQKLFLCLATLISRGKQLASQLQKIFTQRYGQHQNVAPIQTKTTKTASKLSNFSGPNSSASSSATQMLISQSHSSEPAVDESILKAADNLELICDNESNFGVDVVDFGLRLGSFLSEAGWLSESIAILKCVAIRLRNMERTKKIQIIYLDCLQR